MGDVPAEADGFKPGASMAFYIYQDPQEYWRWYLLGSNHRRIAESSQGYDDRQECRDAIALVKGSGTVPVYEV